MAWILRRPGTLLVIVFLLACLSGCVSVPKDFLEPHEAYLEKRQLQMREYDTLDEEAMVSSVAGVLQDLGFTLDESETEIGLVSASKKSDATHAGQMTAAVIVDILGALGGGYSDTVSKCDAIQHVKASVIAKPSRNGERMVVRVTFQRIIWNRMGQISRVETVSETEIYQKFYEGLSKAVFLEANEI